MGTGGCLVLGSEDGEKQPYGLLLVVPHTVFGQGALPSNLEWK